MDTNDLFSREDEDEFEGDLIAAYAAL